MINNGLVFYSQGTHALNEQFCDQAIDGNPYYREISIK